MDWSYFEKFDRVNGLFLPDCGEGENKATQIVTAVNKLVYKWYNDGDVYDNTHSMTGWANDLSSYANWLHKYVPASRPILERIWECWQDEQYEQILADLADALMDGEDLEHEANNPKVGTIYKCYGPFRFVEYEEYEEDEENEDTDW